jgi:hypothetical protein
MAIQSDDIFVTQRRPKLVTKLGRPTIRKNGVPFTDAERAKRYRLRHKRKRLKSISDNEDEIILGIMQLHNNDEPFDVDASYSIGGFYRSGRVPVPALKFDIDPQVEGVQQADVKELPLQNTSVKSIIFDPPFMFNPHGNIRPAGQRYTMFPTWDDLERTYKDALWEFRRILVPKGIVAWKCHDYTDSTTTMTHCLLYNWANDAEFYTKDLFIRYRNNGAAYKIHQIQRHARKFHSYWYVFEKRTLDNR